MVNGERSDRSGPASLAMLRSQPRAVVIIAGVNDVYRAVRPRCDRRTARDVRAGTRGRHSRCGWFNRSLQHGDCRPELANARNQFLDSRQRYARMRCDVRRHSGGGSSAGRPGSARRVARWPASIRRGLSPYGRGAAVLGGGCAPRDAPQVTACPALATLFLSQVSMRPLLAALQRSSSSSFSRRHRWTGAPGTEIPIGHADRSPLRHRGRWHPPPGP